MWAVAYFKHKPQPKQIAAPTMTPQLQSPKQQLPLSTSSAGTNVVGIADWVSKQPDKVFRG